MSAPKVRHIKVNLLPPMISSNPAECGTRGAISKVRSNRDAWRCADRSIASSRPLADPGQVIGHFGIQRGVTVANRSQLGLPA